MFRPIAISPKEYQIALAIFGIILVGTLGVFFACGLTFTMIGVEPLGRTFIMGSVACIFCFAVGLAIKPRSFVLLVHIRTRDETKEGKDISEMN